MFSVSFSFSFLPSTNVTLLVDTRKRNLRNKNVSLQ